MVRKAKARSRWVTVRLTPREVRDVERAARRDGFRTVAEWLRAAIVEKQSKGMIIVTQAHGEVRAGEMVFMRGNTKDVPVGVVERTHLDDSVGVRIGRKL